MKIKFCFFLILSIIIIGYSYSSANGEDLKSNGIDSEDLYSIVKMNGKELTIGAPREWN